MHNIPKPQCYTIQLIINLFILSSIIITQMFLENVITLKLTSKERSKIKKIPVNYLSV